MDGKLRRCPEVPGSVTTRIGQPLAREAIDTPHRGYFSGLPRSSSGCIRSDERVWTLGGGRLVRGEY